MDIQKRLNEFKKVVKVRNELNNETDRGCCLMAAAFLDKEIENLLRNKLVGSRKLKDSLFDFNGPLGTFSARIKLAFSIGLLGKTAMHDLEIIRGIRNNFGHNYDPISFETETIKKEILKLKSTHYTDEDKKEIRIRSIFTNSVSGILAELYSTLNNINKFEEKTDSFLDDVKAMMVIRALSDDLISFQKESKNLSPEEVNHFVKQYIKNQIAIIEKLKNQFEAESEGSEL